MRKINLTNYEAYFLDYSEGNLSAEHLHDLRLFLNLYPKLKKELEEFNNCSLPEKERPTFPGKNKLLKDEKYGLSELEMLLIGKIENELKAEGELKLAQELMNPTVQTEYAQYQKTILREDKKVSFKRKANLKKSIAKPWLKYAAIAAVSISIAFFWFSTLQDNHFSSQAQQATMKEESSTETNPSEQADPKIEMKKIPSSGLQLAELQTHNSAFIPVNSNEERNPKRHSSLPVQAKSMKKREYQTIVESMPKKPMEHSIQTIAENKDIAKPAAASKTEYATLPEILKEHVNQKILKNTLSIEFPNKDEKGFAFSFKGFEWSHSSN